MKFRPCIDLHNGVVKQIVGSSLSDNPDNKPQTNFVSKKPPEWYANLYKNDNLTGGHIIQLGKGNEDASKKALNAWPKGMQIGGGINSENAFFWLDNGAEALIVTSYVFHDGVIDEKRLEKLSKMVGKNRLVLDLSCRKKDGDYYVVTNRWQNFTNEKVTNRLLDHLSKYCFEYLVHAVDVEGKCSGIETELINILAKSSKIPVTYAGGISSKEHIDQIEAMGKGLIDFTVGSALDIFGGKKLKYQELAEKYKK
ncbi:MAG: phosphoribosylformimino-5-aminoimidazole carboxamide ribotide isomerase [Desulforegulaceae bacterium]|nr:phosphoribosylformimino-5-aminoimidazole carboxamide ribotide isomerase [Desulforegulaceae bacterium]